MKRIIVFLSGIFISLFIVFGYFFYVYKNYDKYGSIYTNSYTAFVIKVLNNRFTYRLSKAFLKNEADILLHVAIATDDISQVKNIVAGGGNLNYTCNMLIAPLLMRNESAALKCSLIPFEFSAFQAVINSKVKGKYLKAREIAKELIEQGVDINNVSAFSIISGWPIEASRNSDYELMNFFVNKGLRPSTDMAEQLMGHLMSNARGHFELNKKGDVLENGLNLSKDEFIAKSKKIIELMESTGVANPQKEALRKIKEEVLENIRVYMDYVRSDIFIKHYVVSDTSKTRSGKKYDYEKAAENARAKVINTINNFTRTINNSNNKRDLIDIKRQLIMYNTLKKEGEKRLRNSL